MNQGALGIAKANLFGKINYLDNYYFNNDVMASCVRELDAIEQWFLDSWAT
jgi:hypothetical protein